MLAQLELELQPPIIDPEMQERRIDRLRKGMKFNYTTANVSRIIKLTKDYTESTVIIKVQKNKCIN